MSFEKTATRLWRRLGPDERLAAATRFWEEPPQEALGGALAALVKARRLRPQVARALPVEAKARTLASLSEPGESVAAALLVALHLGERRPMLASFLDALGLPHEDGILKEDPTAPLAEDRIRAGIAALRGAFPAPHVSTYLNTLWLQDPDRWSSLEGAAGEA